MKKITTLLLLFTYILCTAQEIPYAFNYQAIAKDENNKEIISRTIGVQIALRSGSEKGNTIYQETHTALTNDKGLFILAIGKGTSDQKFTTIDWGANALWIEVALDTENNGNYIVAGSSQLLSVPYALYAKEAGTNNTKATTKNANTTNVSANKAGFVASFTNTNASSGDGIMIQLGRVHGAWENGAVRQLPQPSNELFGNALNTVKGWLKGKKLKVTDITSFFPATSQAETTVFISNLVTAEINKRLGLPKNIVPRVKVFPGYSKTLPNVSINSYTVKFPLGIGRKKVFPGYSLNIPDISIPEQHIGPYSFPKIPEIPLPNTLDFDIPNFNSFANVANSLNHGNEFIAFKDKNGNQVGSIRGESMQEWRERRVFDDVYLTSLAASFVGVDVLDGMASGFAEVNTLIKDYNSMGVEYASGNGDYAEWLERAFPEEHISAGDIVGVKAGKISKNLEGAEQIMAISHKPIVLGNTPEKNSIHLGNNVAFMGQIPVKVLGPVQSGDYIVANTTIKGYGKAIAPEKMTPTDFSLAVGRSWDNHPVEGMKMVNTVIGIHNADWVKIIQKLQLRQKATELKVEKLATSLDKIEEHLELQPTKYTARK